jgi:hypothetical protein
LRDGDVDVVPEGDFHAFAHGDLANRRVPLRPEGGRRGYEQDHKNEEGLASFHGVLLDGAKDYRTILRDILASARVQDKWNHLSPGNSS